MEPADIEVILLSMKPTERFTFGAQYFFRKLRDKITKKETASWFAVSQFSKQVEKQRRIDAGDYQL